MIRDSCLSNIVVETTYPIDQSISLSSWSISWSSSLSSSSSIAPELSETSSLAARKSVDAIEVAGEEGQLPEGGRVVMRGDDEEGMMMRWVMRGVMRRDDDMHH